MPRLLLKARIVSAHASFEKPTVVRLFILAALTSSSTSMASCVADQLAGGSSPERGPVLMSLFEVCSKCGKSLLIIFIKLEAFTFFLYF